MVRVLAENAHELGRLDRQRHVVAGAGFHLADGARDAAAPGDDDGGPWPVSFDACDEIPTVPLVAGRQDCQHDAAWRDAKHRQGISRRRGFVHDMTVAAEMRRDRAPHLHAIIDDQYVRHLVHLVLRYSAHQ